MRRVALLATVLLPLASHAVLAKELPSFMQVGDAFCTNEADFNDYAAHGHGRARSAIETCVTIDRPTRVAVMSGVSGTKTMVRVMAGPMSYSVGWTNGKLPLAGS